MSGKLVAINAKSNWQKGSEGISDKRDVSLQLYVQ
jgi:hypothetical protein